MQYTGHLASLFFESPACAFFSCFLLGYLPLKNRFLGHLYRPWILRFHWTFVLLISSFLLTLFKVAYKSCIQDNCIHPLLLSSRYFCILFIIDSLLLCCKRLSLRFQNEAYITFEICYSFFYSLTYDLNLFLHRIISFPSTTYHE